jgi:nucleoside-diphosphate-sugar epimerase
LTILLTGGTGFIGSKVVQYLHERGEEIICIDINASGNLENQATVIEGDITDKQVINNVFEEYNPSKVIHLAYLLAAESESRPNRAIEVNCLGTDHVFQTAIRNGVNRVVFASSIATYGTPDPYSDTVHESEISPAMYCQYPSLLYGATKQLNEYQAQRYSDEYAVDIISIRPSIVFGPGRESGLSQWASDFITDPVQGEPGHIPYKPSQQINIVYRNDVADLFVNVATTDTVSHQAYNTGGHLITAEKLAETVEEEVGGTVSCNPDADELPLVADVGHDRAATEFGYGLTPLAEAIHSHANNFQ